MALQAEVMDHLHNRLPAQEGSYFSGVLRVHAHSVWQRLYDPRNQSAIKGRRNGAAHVLNGLDPAEHLVSLLQPDITCAELKEANTFEDATMPNSSFKC